MPDFLLSYFFEKLADWGLRLLRRIPLPAMRNLTASDRYRSYTYPRLLLRASGGFLVVLPALLLALLGWTPWLWLNVLLTLLGLSLVLLGLYLALVVPALAGLFDGMARFDQTPATGKVYRAMEAYRRRHHLPDNPPKRATL